MPELRPTLLKGRQGNPPRQEVTSACMFVVVPVRNGVVDVEPMAVQVADDLLLVFILFGGEDHGVGDAQIM